ncbi:GTP cyclohydrolase II [Patescibacteria group bacterium]|nr:GTP cyclohydrolase II [Patescibacteria group bacterium]
MKSITKVEKALKDFKAGKMLVVTDNEDRENEGDLILSASKTTPEKINFMTKYGRGLICVALEPKICERLLFNVMVKNNTERYRTAFLESVDIRKGTSTGISAFDRATTIKALLNSKAKKEDFVSPGHVFPLRARPGGVLARSGHTEAAVDLALLSGQEGAGVICEILQEDGHMARGKTLKEFCHKHRLGKISIQDLIKYRCSQEEIVKKTADATLPTKFGKFKVTIYKAIYNRGETLLALTLGLIKGKVNVLTRIHSECLTGDTLFSDRCDCGKQLELSFKKISEKGAGVIIYLRQEGRGIGLEEKIKAYALQDKGLDTVEANNELGYPADIREYSLAAQVLKQMNIDKIQLLTNNPDKISELEELGVKISKRIPLITKPKKENLKYLRTKRDKLGHLIENL